MAKPITDELIMDIAKYFVQTKSTVRETAGYFGMSKSTVYDVLTKRVRSAYLKEKIDEILEFNRLIAPMRGGESTRRKYMVERAKKLSKT